METMDHIKYWKDNAQHPISKTDVDVSVAPKSEYVKLYKEAVKGLVKEREKEGHLLSIEDCEFIRSKLPSAHTKVYGTFYYDHLFVKYFLNNKKYNYVPEYVAYGTDMFLYLHLNKCIKRKPLTSLHTTSHSSSFEKEDYQTTEDLLRGNIRHLSFTTGELSISKIMKNLCEDIKAVLYLNINPLTIEQYDRICKNMKVLQYVYHIYEISAFSDKISADITGIFFLNTEDKELKHIYDTIKANDVSIFIRIYTKIKLLYKYCFPFYCKKNRCSITHKEFKVDYTYVYNNSSNCNKNSCSISLEEFTDDYALDTGDVSILPYFKGTKLKENINEYSCFSTEGLYKWIESKRGESFDIKSFEVRNPKTNEPLTLLDIIYVYKNKVRLIERAIIKATLSEKERLTSERNDINKIINQLIEIEDNKAATEQFEKLGLFKLSRGDDEVKNSIHYLYLTIHLGSKSYPITFNVITDKKTPNIIDRGSSRVFKYNTFGNANGEIDLLVSAVYTPQNGSFNYLINQLRYNNNNRNRIFPS